MNNYVGLIAGAVSPSMPEDVAEQMSGSHLTWLRHDELRAALRNTWAEWFEHYDVLLAPAWSTPPFEHDQEGSMIDHVVTVNGEPRNHFEISHWLMIVNVVNHPSAVVPIGRTAAGLPVGMQIVAPYLQDRTAIRVAELVSEVVGGTRCHPASNDGVRVGGTIYRARHAGARTRRAAVRCGVAGRRVGREVQRA